jgi:hypothetical protein
MKNTLPLSDTEIKRLYRDADEVESFGAEAPIPTCRPRVLLEHLGITTTPGYWIKEVLRPGQVEFKAIIEIFLGSRVLCRQKGPTFRASGSDVVVDAAWQAITSWVCSNKSRLQNSIHRLLPYRKKDQFKAYGVKKDIPRMETVHHQDVLVELHPSVGCSVRDLDSLHLATERGCHHPHMRMVDGQAVTNTHPTQKPGQPPPRSRVQARNPQWTITPPPYPVFARSP